MSSRHPGTVAVLLGKVCSFETIQGWSHCKSHQVIEPSMNWGLSTKVPANCPSEKVSTLVSLSISHPAGMTSIFSFEELSFHQSGDGKCCPRTETRGKSWSLESNHASPLTAMLGKLFYIITSLHVENKPQLPDYLERGFHEVLYRESSGHCPPGPQS